MVAAVQTLMRLLLPCLLKLSVAVLRVIMKVTFVACL